MNRAPVLAAVGLALSYTISHTASGNPDVSLAQTCLIVGVLGEKDPDVTCLSPMQLQRRQLVIDCFQERTSPADIGLKASLALTDYVIRGRAAKVDAIVHQQIEQIATTKISRLDRAMMEGFVCVVVGNEQL